MKAARKPRRFPSVWLLLLLGFLLFSFSSTEKNGGKKVPGVAAPPSVRETPAESIADPLDLVWQTEKALAEAHLPARNLWDISHRLIPSPGDSYPDARPGPQQYQIGDSEEFWINNQDAGGNVRITATLAHVTPHIYMWIQDDLEINQEDIAHSARVFDTEIFPTSLHYFAPDWAHTDAGSRHLTVLNARFVGAAGYYSSADEYPSWINPYSNGRTMIYMNIDALPPGSENYLSTLAHEFQHMLHWQLDPSEDTWVNEGASELASSLNGYADVYRIQAFLREPDTQLNSWSDQPGDSYRHYGAAHLVMQYFLDRVGENGLRRLVSSPAVGLKGFDEVLTPLGFDAFFRDWVAANYLDDHSLMDGRYGYGRSDLPEVTVAEVHDSYPVMAARSVHQYAADYVMLRPSGSDDVRIEFQGMHTVGLIPNQPHGGDLQWWSNRGDLVDCRLTRHLDLSNVNAATLRFWLWYDIEANWDYAYVEASTDGGLTWEILRGVHSTNENPNGNALGWAYTGMSGGGSSPRWVDESIDLSGYGGRAILVRFEYITDDAINHVGLCLDDISIPEIGYAYDAESERGEWEADGFVRVGSEVPQRYAVQLIQFGSTATVTQIALDDQMRGSFRICGFGRDVERAILVISGLARGTTEEAEYSYWVTPME